MSSEKRAEPRRSSSRRATWAAALAVLALTLGAVHSLAHELRPAALSVVERGQGRFALRYTPPVDPSGLSLPIEPRFPDHCTQTDALLDCGAPGLRGEVEFPDLEFTTQRVLARIQWLNGETSHFQADAENPGFSVQGAPGGASLAVLGGLFADYVELGVEHILTGFDHVLFVLGLILLVGYRRGLLWTITAFTLAHSVTLALSVFGLVTLRSAPVEAAIALSILFVAVECTRTTTSHGDRTAWAVAFGFGLLHGFGFAGALAEVGLPPHQTPLGLLAFNVGVELGQAAIVLSGWAVTRLVARPLPGVRRVFVYGLGALAAFWTIDRALILLNLQ